MCLSAVGYYCCLLWTFTNLHFVIISSFKLSDIGCVKKIVYYFPICDRNIYCPRKTWCSCLRSKCVTSTMIKLDSRNILQDLSFAQIVITEIIAKYFIYKFLLAILLSNCYNVVILELHNIFFDVYPCISDVYLLSCLFTSFFFPLALKVLFTCTCVLITECLSVWAFSTDVIQ